MRWLVPQPPKSGAGRGRYPTYMACGPAFMLPLIFCVLVGRVGSPVPLAGQVAVLAGMAALTGWLAAAAAGVLTIVTAMLSLNGFGENGFGVISVHPRVDGLALSVLVGAWGLAWFVRDLTLDHSGGSVLSGQSDRGEGRGGEEGQA